MKPTSIIFLVLSVLLAAGGVALCYTAGNMAEKQEIPLYEQTLDEDGNRIVSRDFTDDDINRFRLDLRDTDVNIIGGADECRVELINFPSNGYNLSSATKTVTVENSMGMLSGLKVTESGFRFSGLRHYLNADTWSDDLPRTVNIYVSSAQSLKKLDINLERGSISVKDITGSADFSFTLKSGDIVAENLRTESVFRFTGTGETNITLDNVQAGDMSVEAENGDIAFNLTGYDYHSFKIVSSDGVTFSDMYKGMTYEHNGYIQDTVILLHTKDGSVVVGG